VKSLEKRFLNDQLAPKGHALCYQQKTCGKALQATSLERLCTELDWYDSARNIDGSLLDEVNKNTLELKKKSF